jgi:hypothetical protein
LKLETKSSLSQLKNTVEGHYTGLEHVEDRISGLKNKVYIIERRIKGKKTWNMQEL